MYEVKVFTNTRPQTYIERIVGTGGFSKAQADAIAGDVNAVLYQLGINAYAKVNKQ